MLLPQGSSREELWTQPKNRFGENEICYIPGTYSAFFFSHFYFPASGQAVVTGVVPSPPPVLAFIFYRA